MERIPQQPRQLDPIDEQSLAVLGRRIERWDILKDTSLSFKERKAKLTADLREEVESLHAIGEDGDHDENETAELILEMKDVHDVEESEEAFAHLYQDRIEYNREVRAEFLKTL